MAQFVMVIQGHKDIANPAWFPEFLDLLKVILPTSYGIQHPVNQNLTQKNRGPFFGTPQISWICLRCYFALYHGIHHHKTAILGDTVDGRNPKQPPGMCKPL